MKKVILGGLAAGAFALGLAVAGPAHADEKVPNQSCPPSSACMQSYFQGHQQTMNEYMSSPGSFGDRVGPVSHPDQAAAYCRNELATANPAPANSRSFLGGCYDTVLAYWANTGQISQMERLRNSYHI
jgi:hypothetical protein